MHPLQQTWSLEFSLFSQETNCKRNYCEKIQGEYIIYDQPKIIIIMSTPRVLATFIYDKKGSTHTTLVIPDTGAEANVAGPFILEKLDVLFYQLKKQHNQVLIAANGSKLKILAVSYTHLTLPTNREV